MKKNNISPWLYWTPRVLAILMLLFMTVFSWDVFDENLGFWGTVLGLLIHNLPVIVLAIVLWISWKKREIVGAVAFILAGLLYIFGCIMKAINGGFQWYYLLWILIIAGPLFAIGILFLMNWINRRKREGKKR